jgi:hypothetical protein
MNTYHVKGCRLKTFVLTFTEAANTRWHADDAQLAELLRLVGESVAKIHTAGAVPSVAVNKARAANLCQCCRAALAVQNQLCADCLSTMRTLHAETYAPKGCRCEMCERGEH